MKRNELIIKLRLDFNNYIRDNYLKDKCERCGSTENLHLHHVYKFSVQLERALDILKYSDKENFNNIIDIRGGIINEIFKKMDVEFISFNNYTNFTCDMWIYCLFIIF